MVDSSVLREVSRASRGIAALHKEMVEELFQRGLINVVFATETLSLGINMRLRSRRLVVHQFDGVSFSNLTTGELTQLMGRAGRRGIDVIRHGVISRSRRRDRHIYEWRWADARRSSRSSGPLQHGLNLLRVYTQRKPRADGEVFRPVPEAIGADRTRTSRRPRQAGGHPRMWDDSRFPSRRLPSTTSSRIAGVDPDRSSAPSARRGAERDRSGAGATQGSGPLQQARAEARDRSQRAAGRQRKLKVVRSPRFGEHYGDMESCAHWRGRSKRASAKRPARWTNTPQLRRLSRILTDTDSYRRTPYGQGSLRAGCTREHDSRHRGGVGRLVEGSRRGALGGTGHVGCGRQGSR